MTKTLTITYGVNPTKAEEIAIVAKLVEAFGDHPDLYLADLFTANFLRHVTALINNDLSPNVIEELQAAGKRANKAEADLHEQTLATANAENRARIWAAQNEATKREAQATIGKLNDEIINKLERLEQYSQRLRQYEGRIAELEANELKLKAHLYDLMAAAAAK